MRANALNPAHAYTHPQPEADTTPGRSLRLMIGAQDKQPGLRYVAVAEQIAMRIEDGMYGVGDRLPSQQHLARELGVSLTTVRAAIDLLQERGRLRSDHGLGTFVTEPATQRPRALAIDDDPAAVLLLKEALNSEGFDVQGASSHAEAVAAASGQSFDVIFLDLVMPGGSGVETLAAFHSLDIRTPVILVTGTAEASLIENAMDYGPLTLIRKPMQLGQLRAALLNLRLLDSPRPVRRVV